MRYRPPGYWGQTARTAIGCDRMMPVGQMTTNCTAPATIPECCETARATLSLAARSSSSMSNASISLSPLIIRPRRDLRISRTFDLDLALEAWLCGESSSLPSSIIYPPKQTACEWATGMQPMVRAARDPVTECRRGAGSQHADEKRQQPDLENEGRQEPCQSRAAFFWREMWCQAFRASRCQGREWCCRTGLNCRPPPYQGGALPLSYGSPRAVRGYTTAPPLGKAARAPPNIRVCGKRHRPCRPRACCTATTRLLSGAMAAQSDPAFAHPFGT
jgi:hypothetical protein